MRRLISVGQVLFSIFFVLVFYKTAVAGVPIPWGAKLIRDDTAITGLGEERNIKAYETGASKQELLNYYLKEMPMRGYSLFMNGEQNLVFNKEKELVVIIVPPTKDGKTQFMITTAAMPSPSALANPAGGNMANCEPIPSVPAYPGARCMQSTRLKSGGTRSASYSTDDQPATVLNFYRTQMPQYMWKLEKEINLGDVMATAMQSGQQQAPMTPDQEAMMNEFMGSARGIFFSNSRGNGCSVHVMNNPVGKAASLISITYEEKTSVQ